MIIILEGPDGSGKSTLAEKLHKQTGYQVLHRTQPKTDEDKKRMMDEYVQVLKAGKNIIMDRAWYSELVYGPVMRDTSVIDFTQMYALERLAAKNGAIIVHCTAPEATLWKRCLSRGEDYIKNREVFHAICKRFNTLMHEVPHLIPVFTYEYEDV
jgi:thymidylate kinase